MAPDRKHAWATRALSGFVFATGRSDPLNVAMATAALMASVAADGQRFLVIARDDKTPPPAPAPITVVVNWREQLKRPQ